MKNDLHPTMKPVELLKIPIKNSSLPQDIIVDIFAGSGSTLIAAQTLNRISYNVELDEHYCDVIKNRWEELTGEKAVKVE